MYEWRCVFIYDNNIIKVRGALMSEVFNVSGQMVSFSLFQRVFNSNLKIGGRETHCKIVKMVVFN